MGEQERRNDENYTPTVVLHSWLLRSSTTMPEPLLIPGETRIRDADGFVGTVVYVGPVASAKNADEP